jgi:hypothetical protein
MSYLFVQMYFICFYIASSLNNQKISAVRLPQKSIFSDT